MTARLSPVEDPPMVTVQRAGSPADIDAVRGLMREFNRWVMAEVVETDNPSIFAEFDAELASLPGRYGPPSGCLVLARLHGEPAGCAAFCAHDATTVEIKRVFVSTRSRGHHLGQQMMALLLAQARAAGYCRALLSSHHSMHTAHAIYRRAGFRDVAPSAAFPGAVAGIDVCMAMALTADTSQ
jgi:putative acetyltransferase